MQERRCLTPRTTQPDRSCADSRRSCSFGGAYKSRDTKDAITQACRDSQFLLAEALAADESMSIEAMRAVIRAVGLMYGRGVSIPGFDPDGRTAPLVAPHVAALVVRHADAVIERARNQAKWERKGAKELRELKDWIASEGRELMDCTP